MRLQIDSSHAAHTEQSSASVMQLLAVAFCCFCAGGLYGWSALIPAIEEKITQSTQLAGLIFSVSIVAFTLSVLLTPRLPPIFRNVDGCVVFGVIGAIAVGLASQSQNYFMFLATFSVGFGACSGAIYINTLSVAAMASRPVILTPIMVACFGSGGASFGPLWSALVDNGWGQNALWPLAVALFMASLMTRITLNMNPGADSSALHGNNTQRIAEYNMQSTGIMTMLLWLTFAFGSMGGLMVLGLASKFIEHSGGSVFIVSLALAGVAIGNTTGRLLVSVYMLFVAPIYITLSASMIIVAGLTLTLFATNELSVSSGLIIVATGYGTMASAIPTLTRTIFPVTQFAQRFSVIFTSWGVAGLLAPWIAGALFDATKSFDIALLAALMATFAGIITAVLLQRSIKMQCTL